MKKKEPLSFDIDYVGGDPKVKAKFNRYKKIFKSNWENYQILPCIGDGLFCDEAYEFICIGRTFDTGTVIIDVKELSEIKHLDRW